MLSAHEVYEDGTSYQKSGYDTAWDKTRQLDYYANLGVTTSNYSGAIKKYNGSNNWWWLRGAKSNSYTSFFSADDAGFCLSIDAIASDGFAPAFRIG